MKVKCPVCHGKKEYNVESDSFKNPDGSKVVYPVDCDVCNKTGKVDKHYTYQHSK